MTKAFGYQVDDMIGKNDRELTGKDEADQHMNNDLLVLHEKASATFEEFHMQDGEKRFALSVKFPLKNELGEIGRYWWYFH